MPLAVDALVFDLEGTLITYDGFGLSWPDHYPAAFAHAARELSLALSPAQLDAACTALTTFNPQVVPREIEIPAEQVFAEATRTWPVAPADATKVATTFYGFFRKHVTVYADVAPVLRILKERGYPVGVLTDLPTGMPTGLARQDLAPLAFVGDEPKDVATARNCGAPAIRLDRRGSAPPGNEALLIRTLADLIELLGIY